MKKNYIYPRTIIHEFKPLRLMAGSLDPNAQSNPGMSGGSSARESMDFEDGFDDYDY